MTKHDLLLRQGVGKPHDVGLAHSTLRASVALSRRTAVLLIAAGLAGSWLIVHLAGGVDSMVPHWYYVPILLAATRFGPIAAMLVAVVAGLMAGPMTHVDVAAGTQQELQRWMTRTGFFIGIGQLMAWMVAPSLRPIGEELRRIRQEHNIRHALGNNEFFLRYQPIYSVEKRRFTGVEALIRWQHPELGELSPSQFVEVAEDSSLVHDISDFVIDEACRQGGAWYAHATKHGRMPCHMAINLSARDLERPELAQILTQALERYAFPPELLHVELTESVLAFEGATFQMRQLKKLGIKLAIDDFGTGYSSLSYLNRFPVDILKVDRSLISDLKPDAASQALARGMVLLADSLGLATVAEGVETKEQLAIGRKLNFNFMQGYYFGRPQLSEDIPALMLEMTATQAYSPKSLRSKQDGLD